MHCGKRIQFSNEMLSLLLIMISTSRTDSRVLILDNYWWHAPMMRWQTHIHGIYSRGDREVAQTYHPYASLAARLLVTLSNGITARYRRFWRTRFAFPRHTDAGWRCII